MSKKKVFGLVAIIILVVIMVAIFRTKSGSDLEFLCGHEQYSDNEARAIWIASGVQVVKGSSPGYIVDYCRSTHNMLSQFLRNKKISFLPNVMATAELLLAPETEKDGSISWQLMDCERVLRWSCIKAGRFQGFRSNVESGGKKLSVAVILDSGMSCRSLDLI